jgi:hypothetical protein
MSYYYPRPSLSPYRQPSHTNTNTASDQLLITPSSMMTSLPSSTSISLYSSDSRQLEADDHGWSHVPYRTPHPPTVRSARDRADPEEQQGQGRLIFPTHPAPTILTPAYLSPPHRDPILPSHDGQGNFSHPSTRRPSLQPHFDAPSSYPPLPTQTGVPLPLLNNRHYSFTTSDASPASPNQSFTTSLADTDDLALSSGETGFAAEEENGFAFSGARGSGWPGGAMSSPEGDADEVGEEQQEARDDSDTWSLASIGHSWMLSSHPPPLQSTLTTNNVDRDSLTCTSPYHHHHHPYDQQQQRYASHPEPLTTLALSRIPTLTSLHHLQSTPDRPRQSSKSRRYRSPSRERAADVERDLSLSPSAISAGIRPKRALSSSPPPSRAPSSPPSSPSSFNPPARLHAADDLSPYPTAPSPFSLLLTSILAPRSRPSPLDNLLLDPTPPLDVTKPTSLAQGRRCSSKPTLFSSSPFATFPFPPPPPSPSSPMHNDSQPPSTLLSFMLPADVLLGKFSLWLMSGEKDDVAFGWGLGESAGLEMLGRRLVEGRGIRVS